MWLTFWGGCVVAIAVTALTWAPAEHLAWMSHTWGIDELDEYIASLTAVAVSLSVLSRLLSVFMQTTKSKTNSKGGDEEESTTGFAGNASAVLDSLGKSPFDAVSTVFVISFFVGLYTCNAMWSSLPFVIVMTFGHRGTGYNWKVEKVNHIVLSYCFVIHHMFVCFVICKVTGMHYASEYAAITPCLTFMMALGRTDLSAVNDLQHLVVRGLWDPPLFLASAIVFYVLQSRLLHDGYGAFVSVIDEKEGILMSSFPFPSDVKTHYQAHNVGTVINMCEEYRGPVSSYKQHGITQHRFPVCDISSPSTEVLQAAVDVIAKARHEQPDKTVVVHCKGGRARASSVVLCYLSHATKADPRTVLRTMKKQRHCVEPIVLTYPPVQRLLSQF